MFLPMTDTWRERLREHLARKHLTMRGVSLAAGMGEGYVFSIMQPKNPKEPTVENLLAVCQASGASPAYVILGYEVPADAAELFELWAKASPATRQGILQILAQHKAA